MENSGGGRNAVIVTPAKGTWPEIRAGSLFLFSGVSNGLSMTEFFLYFSLQPYYLISALHRNGVAGEAESRRWAMESGGTCLAGLFWSDSG